MLDSHKVNYKPKGFTSPACRFGNEEVIGMKSLPLTMPEHEEKKERHCIQGSSKSNHGWQPIPLPDCKKMADLLHKIEKREGAKHLQLVEESAWVYNGAESEEDIFGRMHDMNSECIQPPLTKFPNMRREDKDPKQTLPSLYNSSGEDNFEDFGTAPEEFTWISPSGNDFEDFRTASEPGSLRLRTSPRYCRFLDQPLKEEVTSEMEPLWVGLPSLASPDGPPSNIFGNPGVNVSFPPKEIATDIRTDEKEINENLPQPKPSREWLPDQHNHRTTESPAHHRSPESTNVNTSPENSSDETTANENEHEVSARGSHSSHLPPCCFKCYFSFLVSKFS